MSTSCNMVKLIRKLFVIQLTILFEENVDWVYINKRSRNIFKSNVKEMVGYPIYFLLKSDVDILLQIPSLHMGKKRKILRDIKRKRD